MSLPPGGSEVGQGEDSTVASWLVCVQPWLLVMATVPVPVEEVHELLGLSIMTAAKDQLAVIVHVGMSWLYVRDMCSGHVPWSGMWI